MKDKLKQIHTDLPIITGNYQVLHFDDEPILFTGTNIYGNRIIGSLLDEDDEAGVSRYFYVIVDSRLYTDFRKCKVSYLQILKNSKPIYVIERSFDAKKTDIYFLSFDEVPEDYLPTEESFCPVQTSSLPLTYFVKLKGALADTNMALPREISNIQMIFAEMLESIPKTLKNILHEPPVAFQRSYSEGSFALNFEISLKFEDMFIKDAKVTEYLNNFLGYCTEHLPKEADKLYEPESEAVTFFDHLISGYEELYSEVGVSLPEKYKEKVREEIKKSSESIAEMTETIGDHFTGIEIANDIENPRPIAYLDADFKQTIESVVDIIQSKTQNVEEDREPREYDIYVYHLNKESRAGNAIIINDDQEKTMSRPKIKILGDEPLDHTKYTESLHLNERITVRAKAKKVDGKCRNLEIEFEEK